MAPHPVLPANDAPSGPAGEAGAAPGGETRAAAAALLRLAAEAGGVVAGPHLVVVSGDAAGERIALAPVQTLGRGRGADVRIRDPAASRVHARLRVEAGGATVEDLRSKNGLSVNGARVGRGRRRLAAGDEIAVGGTVLAFEEAFPGAGVERAANAPRSGTTAAVRWLAAALLAACAGGLLVSAWG